MDNKRVGAVKIAAAYIGTVVGAGFATGQEIFQFFSKFGIPGLLGIAVCAVMFIFFGGIIMRLGAAYSARSYEEIIKRSCGKIFGALIDGIITVFLFAAYTTMLAGTGALFAQQFGLSQFLGSVVMTILCTAAVLSGLSAVINSISFTVPFLLAAAAGVSVITIINLQFNFFAFALLAQSGLQANWLTSSLLYVSYNTILAISVLAPLGARAEGKNAINAGALLGGLGLAAVAVLIYLALAANLSDIRDVEIPMIYIAGNFSHTLQLFYAVVLIAEIYTTAVGAFYGFISRIIDINSRPVTHRIIIIASAAAALAASRFGFSNFIKYLYPIVGYAGFALLTGLVINYIKSKLNKNK